MDPRVKPRAIAYDFFAAFRFVIPDGERSEPIRDPSIPAFGNQGEAGVLGSRLSRLTALGRDDKSKGRVICDSPAPQGRAVRGMIHHVAVHARPNRCKPAFPGCRDSERGQACATSIASLEVFSS